jgi:hypothetical protein
MGTFSAVARVDASAATCSYIQVGPQILGSNAAQPAMVLWNGSTSFFQVGSNSYGAWHTGIGVINGASSVVGGDGTELAGTLAPNAAAGTIAVFGGGAGLSCSFQEAIWWDNYALTAGERTALTANQQQYWMPYALDTFTTPAAAYSLRKLKSTYAGPAIRLRRASDNAEQDINFLGFVPGLGSPLDMAAANAHCAATSCFIAIWYDQSGNARDMVQATPANQPAFIFNCNGTLPCGRSASPMLLQTAANFTPSAVASLSGVAKRSAGTGNYFVASTDSANNLYIDLTPNWYLVGATGPVGVVGTSGAWGAAVGVINGASSVLRLNAVENTGAVTSNVAANKISTASGAATSSDFTETIIWDNYALTAGERAALTANQRAYFGF